MSDVTWSRSHRTRAAVALIASALGLAACSGPAWDHPQLGTSRLQADLDQCAAAAQDYAQQVAAAQGTTALSPLKSAPARAGHVYGLGPDEPPAIGREPSRSLGECMRAKGYRQRLASEQLAG